MDSLQSFTVTPAIAVSPLIAMTNIHPSRHDEACAVLKTLVDRAAVEGSSRSLSRGIFDDAVVTALMRAGVLFQCDEGELQLTESAAGLSTLGCR